MLLLCQRLRQGINNVVICMYLSYFHISSDEMEVAKNMFGSLMRSGFLCLRNGSIVVTIEFYNIRSGRVHIMAYMIDAIAEAYGIDSFVLFLVALKDTFPSKEICHVSWARIPSWILPY
ncbi:hypothetical protein V6N12_012861 [Hibiscus sabdariffa]|uniref:Uncharacterized protein n=1 Tax=Hibiscus sabdariffa TaxID=183260 RepID=A0ABR2EFM5_9ROSI